MSQSTRWFLIALASLVGVSLVGLIAWRIFQSRPSLSANLHGVALISATEGWAVGDTTGSNGDLLMHYAHNKWTRSTLPTGLQASDSLIGVAFDSPTDGWVIGANPRQIVNGRDTAGILIHLTNGVGQVTERTLPGVPRAIAFDGATNGWLAGDDGLVMHYDGTTWHQMVLPNELSNLSFTALSLIGPNDIWLSDVFGNIAHFDGQQWKLTQLGYHNATVAAFSMTTDQSGWVLINPTGSAQTLALHNIGGEWLPVQLPQNKVLTGLVLSSDSDGWAVGGSGTILKLHNGTWSTQKSTTNDMLNAIASSGDAAIAVGQNGAIVSYHGNAWSSYLW